MISMFNATRHAILRLMLPDSTQLGCWRNSSGVLCVYWVAMCPKGSLGLLSKTLLKLLAYWPGESLYVTRLQNTGGPLILSGFVPLPQEPGLDYPWGVRLR